MTEWTDGWLELASASAIALLIAGWCVAVVAARRLGRPSLLSLYSDAWRDFVEAFKESPALALAPFCSLLRRQSLATSERELLARFGRRGMYKHRRDDN